MAITWASMVITLASMALTWDPMGWKQIYNLPYTKVCGDKNQFLDNF